MAERIPIGQGPEPSAKTRHPVAVPALMIVTLGIYGIYWWYQINREMVDLGRARNVDGLGDSPTKSLLAVFPGFLIIVPPYVSLYNTIKRIQRAQEVTTGQVTLNGMIVLWLIIAGFIVGVAGIIVPGYIQAELNKAWAAVGAGASPELEATAPPPPTAPAVTAEPATQPPPAT
ncbi:MAG: DUF4234 domain-containing protein [Solirubrobacterales bacterium]